MESWLSEQASRMVQGWETSIGQYYPHDIEDWTDPHAHYTALCDKWNTLPAVEYVDWDMYLLGDALKILDLGAGTGWLSILLSRRDNVERIYALDSSATNLKTMLPPLTDLMGGHVGKITPVLALFTPILVADGFFDVIVASSAVHHAPDLAECLLEMHRVLKPGGFFLILNEQPVSYRRYTSMVGLRCLRLMSRVVMQRWQRFPNWVSESGLVIDPHLGDRAYGEWQWKRALDVAGFSFRRMVTPYYPYRDTSDRRNTVKLTHYIAQKSADSRVSRA